MAAVPLCASPVGKAVRAKESLGAAAVMVLYLLMGHSVTYQWYVHAVFLLAFTYCLNNTLVIITAVASPSTQNHVQQTLYYSLYHCTAGLLFLVGCAVFYGVDRGDSLRFRNITGVLSAPAMCPAIGRLSLCHLPDVGLVKVDHVVGVIAQKIGLRRAPALPPLWRAVAAVGPLDGTAFLRWCPP
ncbi:hypothetical protein MRX96_018529 [Rhipicephalus microplus]